MKIAPKNQFFVQNSSMKELSRTIIGSKKTVTKDNKRTILKEINRALNFIKMLLQ
jgi:hypothetical protein